MAIFLDLPIEIREMIYSLSFNVTGNTVITLGRIAWTQPEGLQVHTTKVAPAFHGLMLSCKTVHEETKTTMRRDAAIPGKLHSQADLTLTNGKCYLAWLTPLWEASTLHLKLRWLGDHSKSTVFSEEGVLNLEKVVEVLLSRKMIARRSSDASSWWNSVAPTRSVKKLVITIDAGDHQVSSAQQDGTLKKYLDPGLNSTTEYMAVSPQEILGSAFGYQNFVLDRLVDESKSVDVCFGKQGYRIAVDEKVGAGRDYPIVRFEEI